MTNKAVETGKAIRKELREQIPGKRFSVKKNGLDAVYIDWEGVITGQEAALIEALAKKHELGYFDSMTDSYEYCNVNKAIPQVQYVIPMGKVEK